MAKKKTAGRIKVVYAFLLLFGPALILIGLGVMSAKGCQHKFKQLPDLGLANNYSFVDASGKEFTQKDFEGTTVLVTTIQETCPNDCAVSLVNLKLQIYQLALNSKGQLKIISFVTDKDGNQVKDLSIMESVLKDYIPEYDPNYWMLASGDPKKVFDLKKDGRKLIDEKGDEFYGGIAYQEMMLLLDRKNHLRMIRSGDEEGMIREMKQHIALLQKQYDSEAKHGKK